MSAQAVKDVISSYESLVILFGRIQFFLQRLKGYATVSLTSDMTLLLGKIMAQVLSVLALSTKEMKERRISGSICLISSFISDYEKEKFMKRLIGRTDVEDALARLDMLTKEENLMTAARNLEVTHRVDINVMATQELTHRVDDKVTTIEEVIHDVDGNVKETKELTRDVCDNVITIDDNVKVTKYGARDSFEIFIHFTHRSYHLWKQQLMSNNVRYALLDSSIMVIAEAHSQGISYERSFENGSLLRIPPSIIISRATSSTKARQCGSSRATNSTNGRGTVRYCGSVAIVSFFLVRIS